MKVVIAVVLIVIVVALCIAAYLSASRRIAKGKSPIQGGVLGRGNTKYVEPPDEATGARPGDDRRET